MGKESKKSTLEGCKKCVRASNTETEPCQKFNERNKKKTKARRRKNRKRKHKSEHKNTKIRMPRSVASQGTYSICTRPSTC